MSDKLLDESEAEPEPKPNLLTIPAELRNRIYDFVFTVKARYLRGIVILRPKRLGEYIPSALRLLEVCYQVYNEAKGIL